MDFSLTILAASASPKNINIILDEYKDKQLTPTI